MPRLIKIEECAYDLFENVRSILLDYVPFAIINDVYHRGTAYFLFFDSSYIPFNLHPFIVAPPFDKEAMEKALGTLDPLLGWGEPPKEKEVDVSPLEATIEKWRVNAEAAYSQGENDVGTTIIEFLADLGDQDAKETLVRLGKKVQEAESTLRIIPMVEPYTIPYTETEQELEEYLKDLPEELQEALRKQWHAKQKESDDK